MVFIFNCIPKRKLMIGIITLDLLKKGDSPTAQAARKAARYIEHASRQYKQLSTYPTITVQLGTNHKRGSGLRFQREDEYRQIDEMSSLPLMPGEEGPPKWVQSVLGCAAYFVGINKAELDNAFDKDERELPPALYIATPSFEIQITQDPTGTRPLTRENREEAERNGSKNERGDGVMLQEEAERFELGIAILRDNDDDKPAFNRSTDRGSRRNVNGLGRNGGGQGDRDRRMPPKPRKKEEAVPEVKVLLRRPQAPGESDQSDSPASVLLGLPDVTIPPPMGINPMAHSRSSNEPSPPKQAHKPLPSDRKSPPSKFVPLTRETHPVRRYAGSTDSSDEPTNRERTRSGRGRGGAAARGTGRKNRERDSEFKNGNFVLLKRPEPAPASPKPTTAPSRSQASVPAPTPRQPTILARRPVPPAVQPPEAKADQSPKPPPAPAPAPVAAPVRTILQRPPAPPAPPPAPATAPPTAPRAFTDTRGRGRGRGGVSRGTAFHPIPPNQNQNRRNLPVKPTTSSAAVFEFDDAMLRPGYGAGSGQASSTEVSPPSNMGMNGRGRGFAPRGHLPMRGRGSVRPPPQQQHVAPTVQTRPLVPSTPAFTPAPVPVPPPAPTPVYGPTTSLVWRPAEPAKKIVLQRPT
jgi:hypothetical protein